MLHIIMQTISMTSQSDDVIPKNQTDKKKHIEMGEIRERRQNVRLGSLLFGSTYLLCGIVQMTAGIAFLILPTVLHIGSNTWTGFLTIVSGSLLINASNRRTKLTVVLGLHVGVLLVNLGNLLLMELGDWRYFLRPQQLQQLIRNGHVKLIVAAYLSTAVPTIVTFISSFLAVQYNCCVLVTIKKQEKLRKQNEELRDTSTLSDSNNFDWVFQEDQWTSHERVFAKSLDYGDGPNALASETDVFYMQTFSSPFRTMPTPFVPSNWSSRNAIPRQSSRSDSLKQHKVINGFPRCKNHSHTLQAEDEEASSAERNNRPKVSTSPEEFASTSGSGFWGTDWSSTIESANLDRSKCEGRPFTTEEAQVPTKVEMSLVTAPTISIAHSSTLPRAEWCLPSRPLATVDADSLIHLSRLELLARQYRFKSQHLTIERQIAVRLNVQKTGFSYTKA